MNEQTSKLIEQLAARLGTTTEYLWGVLLKQAVISAVSSVVFMAGYCILLYLYYRFAIYAIKDLDLMEDGYVCKMVGLIIGGFLSVVLIIAFFCGLSNALNGFLNPEFWALEYILDQLK